MMGPFNTTQVSCIWHQLSVGKQKDIKELLEISCSKDGLQQKHDT